MVKGRASQPAWKQCQPRNDFLTMLDRRLLIIMLALALLSACASVPTQEMSDARQSLQAAYDAGAEKYASRHLRIAEDYLTKAERELELRFYSWARNDAMLAKSEARKAQEVTSAIKSARAAIEAAPADGETLAAARALLEKAITAAKQGKDTAAIRMAREAEARLSQDANE